MKDFIEQQLRLARWQFFISVLNRGEGGGSLKNHPVFCKGLVVVLAEKVQFKGRHKQWTRSGT